MHYTHMYVSCIYMHATTSVRDSVADAGFLKGATRDYRSAPVTTDSPVCIHSLRDTAINDKRIQYTFHSKGMQYIYVRTWTMNSVVSHHVNANEASLQHIRIYILISSSWYSQQRPCTSCISYCPARVQHAKYCTGAT